MKNFNQCRKQVIEELKELGYYETGFGDLENPIFAGTGHEIITDKEINMRARMRMVEQ